MTLCKFCNSNNVSIVPPAELPVATRSPEYMDKHNYYHCESCNRGWIDPIGRFIPTTITVPKIIVPVCRLKK